MSLTLSLAGLSVTLNKFLNTDCPRITLQPLSAVEFSALGSPSYSGTFYEGKYLWSISAICDRHQREALEIISWESESRRRSLQDPNILIYDRTATIKEKLPRSRALVPGTTAIGIYESYIAYYAQFCGLITSELKFTKSGTVDVVSFSITETVRAPV